MSHSTILDKLHLPGLSYESMRAENLTDKNILGDDGEDGLVLKVVEGVLNHVHNETFLLPSFISHNRVKRTPSKSSTSVPMILMPSQSDKECIPSNQLSSIGFVGFILSVVNAGMNIVNNANSNNNDLNNNNNDNNDNNDNINIANLNSGQMNMQMVMAGRSLWTRLKRLLRVERNVKECQARSGAGEV